MGLKCVLTITCLLAIFSGQSVNAQVFYGSIVGAVTDPSGAAVPNASIAIKDTATGQTREVKSDTGGRYTISDVQAGTYEVKITASGFRTTTKTGVTVSINTVTAH